MTKKIRLGPAVAVAPLYHPLRLLEDLVFLDVISGGRSVIGLGSGYQQYEFHKFGVELSKSRGIFLELLDVLEQLMTEGSVEYLGEHVKIPKTHFSLRLAGDRPATYVAGLGNDPETQDRLCTSGYVPFFTKGWATLDVLQALRGKAAASYQKAGGNPANTPFAYQQYVFVTDNRDDAVRAAEGARYIRRIALAMRNRYAELDGSFLREVPAPDEPPLDLLIDRMLIGDSEKCAEMLIAELDGLRPTHMSCAMNLPGMERKKVLRSMERFATEVLPIVAKHFGGLERVGAPEPRGPLTSQAA